MLRVAAVHIALFVLPFVIYGFYLYFRHIDPLKREAWESSAVYWLTLTGLVLTIGGFLALSAFSGSAPGGTYVPARVEDGRLIPGRIE